MIDEIKNKRTASNATYDCDLYDRMTVEACRRIERMYLEDRSDAHAESLSKEAYEAATRQRAKMMAYIAAGERYLDKAETIKKWTAQGKMGATTVDDLRPTDGGYAADKQRFCFSDEEGARYVKFKHSLRDFDTYLSELKARQKDFGGQNKLKQLSLGQVQELLRRELSGACDQVEFPKVEFRGPTVVHVMAQYARASQDRSKGTTALHQRMVALLHDTNWKLTDVKWDDAHGRLRGCLRWVGDEVP
jgi:hypothetical protein